MKWVAILVFLAIAIGCGSLHAQVIRKNYREMTNAEKEILVDAFFALGPPTTSGTAVNDYATNHVQLFFTSIHVNNDFLPWHRWFILHFEKELRNTSVTGAEKIALPYWDWTSQYYTTGATDQQKNSPLWAFSFLGQFNTAWNLGRHATTGVQLGNSNQLGQVLVNTNFTTFRGELESAPFHNSGHNWVGGTMAMTSSPRDPVFYFHHAMVDKVWQDWANLGRVSNFTEQNMPNSLPPGATNFPPGVPYTNPSSILDSRTSSVKVWYAENGKVILDKYTVAGNENYYYTGVIEAGTRVIPTVTLDGNVISFSTGPFTVPSGASCKFVSGGLQMGTVPEAGYIRLVPGFSVQSGGEFIAKINSLYFTDPSAGARLKTPTVKGMSEPQRDVLATEKMFQLYPNPSKGIINISFKHDPAVAYEYTIVNSQGIPIVRNMLEENGATIDLRRFGEGIYAVIVKSDRGETIVRRVVINE